MTILRWPELFYFHEGSPDPAAPPESQGSDENHLRQPYGKVGRLETLEKTMRRRRNLIRVFTLAKDALFISTYYQAPVISKAHRHIYKGVKFCT
jgi:hypothetical protein